ncbi:MAG: hypothetical protein R3E39_28575 [Anaerolineae bacterium]
MPYSINWYIENEVAFTRYWGVVTEEELRDSLLKLKELIDASPRHLVHNISDSGDISEAVPMKQALPIVRDIGGHERAGWSFTIREKSTIVKMASALGASLFKLRYRSFTTFDEAKAYLKEMDQTISWDRANPDVIAHLKSGSNIIT